MKSREAIHLRGARSEASPTGSPQCAPPGSPQDAANRPFSAVYKKRGYGKYRNIPTEVDGVRFSSKAEARRYMDLKMLERAGEITELELQPKFDLKVEGFPICKYYADFRYRTRKGERVVEDVKGVLTKDCKIKLRLVRALYGVDVMLVAA